ncbi:MAG TPA: hypothetical protein VLS49_09810 [Usitatibacter sp.]|nr:hypothetical protein [Usitatibacter sp.]
MSFHIEKTGAGLSVRIDNVAGSEQAVLDKLRDCRRSAWACPSAECTKIGRMDERIADGCVFLSLEPASADPLSAAGIEQCLRYMLHEVADKRSS